MDKNMLRRLQGRWVQVEYGHPLRGGTFGKLDRAYLLRVGDGGHALFVTHREIRSMQTPQAVVPGTAPSQSNVQSADHVQGQYTVIVIECQHIIGVSFSGPVEYTYQPQALQQSGTQIAQSSVKIDNNSLYHFRHGNWEKWEEIFQKAFHEELVTLGFSTGSLEKKTEPVSKPEPSVEQAPPGEPQVPVTLPSEVVTGPTEKI